MFEFFHKMKNPDKLFGWPNMFHDCYCVPDSISYALCQEPFHMMKVSMVTFSVASDFQR